MENNSFHSDLLSVMDVLAKAAVAEINRRVDDSCAVLRLEVSQSRRDIDLLRRKCEVMEAELRRTRMRARKRVFYPPAADRFSPLVRVVLNKETQSTDWDRQMDAEAETQHQQCADMEPAIEAEHILIKVECAEEEMWKNDLNDKLESDVAQAPCVEASQPARTDSFVEPHHSAENAADPGALLSPDSYDTFSDQPLNTNQNEAEHVVKHEREEAPHENAADSAGSFGMEEGDGQLWSSNQWSDAADTNLSYARQHFASVFPSQSGLHLENVVSQIQLAGKSNSVVVSAAQVKQRARTFGLKRSLPNEGDSAASQINTMEQCSIPQQQQNQYSDSMPHQNEDLMPQTPASSSSYAHSRSSFVLARRMRTPWRSGIGEKKFSCTYCVKTFTRCCQLKEHLRSHTGERPYSCKLCGRSFAKQCNLLRHAVVHSGEKPHECSLCGKCFTQRSSLKSHQKTAH
uniref:zinc finger protein 436 n=1 Tax=Semicossyphus pulcher TaxID=241346 RepID=UPI0037E81C22